MLWTKEDADSYADIFAKTNPDSSEIITPEHDELADREYEKRAKRYDKKFDLFAKEHREIGKKLFGKKNYLEAMQEFNRCLMFAQPGSEEVGLAYANRSACFFYLNMSKECLTDIELAKKFNYPENLLNKLDDRVTKCKSLEEENMKPILFAMREPTLDFWEHEKFAGVANCLEIRKNDEFGRYVVTICDLDIGQTILLEKPFSIVPTKFCAQNRDRCFHCFRRLKNVIACEDCLLGLYCNEECTEQAFHSIECGMEIFASDKEKIELVVKTFLNINAAFSDVEILMNTVDTLLNGNDISDDLSPIQRQFCMLFQLVSNNAKYLKEEWKQMENISSIAYHIIKSLPNIKEQYMSKEHHCFVQHLTFHLFYVAEHAIKLYEFIRKDTKAPLASYSIEHYANAIYPFGSNINHSCFPNVYWYCVDDRLVCKVIRPIKKGEQILRSYFPGMESFMRDQKLKTALEEQYHIDCTCHFCSNNMWTPLVDRVNLRQDPLWKEGIAPIFMQVNEFRKLSLDIIESHEKKAIEFMTKYESRHPVRDTISMQEALQVIWNILASPY